MGRWRAMVVTGLALVWGVGVAACAGALWLRQPALAIPLAALAVAPLLGSALVALPAILPEPSDA